MVATRLIRPVEVLAASAVASSITGTTAETALSTIVVPAGAMGINGILRITTQWTVPNSANNKTLRVRFGGLVGTQIQSIVLTTATNIRMQCQIQNRGAANSQTAAANSLGGGGWGSNAGTVIVATANTAAAVDLVLSAQLALASETVTLESYLVELI
jgi:hypothetical protein